MKPDLNHIHQELCSLLKKTNKLILEKFNTELEISYKKSKNSSISIVTQVDHQVEEMIKNKLAKLLPESGFIGEETKPKVKEYNWIIDPIDGTSNFAQAIPIFATSIALWHQNQPLYAIASLPMQNELIHAKKNHGLYLNNQKHLSKPSVTAKFLVYSHGSFDKERYEISNKLKKIIPYPRYFGSCVFNGINIVLDRVDCAIFTKLAIWDIAAIILFAKEANLYYQFISKPPDVNHPNIKSYQHSLVIGPKNLTKSIIKIVKPIIS